MSTSKKNRRRTGIVLGLTAMVSVCATATAQRVEVRTVEYLTDAQTGYVSATRAVELGHPTSDEVLQIYSIQSPQGGVANVGAEAKIYLAPNYEPLAYSVFLNFNSSTGAAFPGVMIADNMGLGGGYSPGVDSISSYDTLFFRSSTDPQPGLADFHIALWDGDPLCQLDTPGGGFACAPIAGTEADFMDIPADTQFTARHILPKGVTAPNQRVWMVVSGSQTGANPSPCRLGWDIAYGFAIIGDNSITGSPHDDDLYLTNEDENNGADGPGGQGICCDTTGGSVGAPCDASSPCDTDDFGSRGACWDDVAETPHVWTFSISPGSRCDMYSIPGCQNFTASISAPAISTISLVDAVDEDGTVSLAGGGVDFALEVRISSWDPDGVGTLLKAWEADIESTGYTGGFQGYLTPTTVACTSDDDCKTAFGGVCSILGDPCITDNDCQFQPIEKCSGSKCGFPVAGPNTGTQCEPGFIFTGRDNYVYLTAGGDLPAVDISTINYRYASAVAAGSGVPATDFTPFPAAGVYAGTLRLTASVDCKGTFMVGFKPPPHSVLVDQMNEFIPLVGLAPAKITVEIGRCCIDLAGAGGCWDNVTQAQCDAGPGATCWNSDPTATCDDPCIECLDDSACQDGLWCNGNEVCDLCTFCQLGTPPDCDDGIACTADSCVEGGWNSGHCDNIPDDSSCDDGLFCTGTESCSTIAGCASGLSPCDDGVTCTVDACDEASQSCTNTPDHAACDNGQFCDGVETCDATNGCLLGTNPCPTSTCDEANDICIVIDNGIPTVSTWGLAVMALLLIVSWKIAFGRRRALTCSFVLDLSEE